MADRSDPARTSAAAAVRAALPDDTRLPGGAAVSVWLGPPGGPAAAAHRADHPYYAASMIKLAVARAALRHRDPAEEVPVHDEFRSAGAGTYRTDREDDNDDEPWQHLGAALPLGRLCARMLCASSNLATDLLLERVGLAACAAEAPPGMVLTRPIGDRAAREAGLSNTVTAAAAARILGDFALDGDDRLLDPMRHQVYRTEIPAALPPGTRVANKNGWVDGILHDAALVEPADAPPFVLAVCTSGLSEDGARAAIHRITRAAWDARHTPARP